MRSGTEISCRVALQMEFPVNSLMAALAAAGLLSGLLARPLFRLLEDGGLTRTNFLGRKIPSAAGLVPVVASLFPSALLVREGVASHLLAPSEGHVFVMVVVVMAMAGFVDDSLGSGDARGLKGHLAKLVRGRVLTTGGLKAIVGGLAGVSAGVLLETQAVLVVLDTAIISLAANAVNLFDLRPGRAGKVFVAGAVTLALSAGSRAPVLLLLPLAVATLVYMPWDLRGRVMLGDTGANALGGALGVTAALSLGTRDKLVFLAMLLILHLVAERFSLSKLIDRVPLLRLLDRLGRG